MQYQVALRQACLIILQIKKPADAFETLLNKSGIKDKNGCVSGVLWRTYC